ncbi:MAG: hypothetical protein LC772_07350, partial [Chloroflexi bacterium]|nr:hypothetical protein [Chloroflexota bacterium]
VTTIERQIEHGFHRHIALAHQGIPAIPPVFYMKVPQRRPEQGKGLCGGLSLPIRVMNIPERKNRRDAARREGAKGAARGRSISSCRPRSSRA